METATQFEVVAVVRRLVASLPLTGASFAAADWALAAAGQVKRWAESVEAEAFRERELAAQFPPLPSGGDGPGLVSEPAGLGAADGAGTGDGATTAPGGEAGDVVSGAAPSASAAGDEPLPSLGSVRPVGSVAERERIGRRSWVLTELPRLAAAFREGRVSTEHVDVLAMQLHRLDEPVQRRLFGREADLLAAAATTSVDGFRRMVRHEVARASDDEGAGRLRDQRQRSLLRHWVRGDDMHGIYLEVDPARGAPLFAALDAEIAALYASGAGKGLTREQVAVTAFCNLQARPASTPTPAGSSGRPDTPDGAGSSSRVSTRRRSAPAKGQAVVLIDIATAIDGLHERSVCETASGVPLPPSVVRDTLCRAAVVYGLTFNGRVVGMSSKQRLATAQQRTMLRMMYRTCAFPGCTIRVEDCEVHHVIHASKGGATAVETMIPLCRHGPKHHDAVHDEGWKVRISADRTLTWAKPGGEVFDVVPFVALADLDRLPATDARAAPQPDRTPRPPPSRTITLSRSGASARSQAVGPESAPEPAPVPTLFDAPSLLEPRGATGFRP